MIRLGVHRLWSDETINEVIGVDDRYVAARGYQSLFVWDHRTGERVTGIDARSITGSAHPAVERRHMAKGSLDGRFVAAASFGNRIRVYENGVMKFADDPEYAYTTVSFAPDGRIVGTAADRTHVWTTGEPTPKRITECTRNAMLDSHGDVVGGAFAGMVGRWSVDNHELARVSVRRTIESLSITSDGRYAAVTTYGTSGLCMWPMPDVVVADLARGRAILRFHDVREDLARTATLSPDARWLGLTDGKGLRLMPATPLPTWQVPQVVAHWPDAHSVTFCTGNRAIVGTSEKRIRLVDVPSGDTIASVAFTEDSLPRWCGRHLAELAANERVVRLRSPRTLEVIGEVGFDHSIDGFAIDDERIAVTDAATIVIAAHGIA